MRLLGFSEGIWEGTERMQVPLNATYGISLTIDREPVLRYMSRPMMSPSCMDQRNQNVSRPRPTTLDGGSKPEVI
jgi:hypothetical protein